MRALARQTCLTGSVAPAWHIELPESTALPPRLNDTFHMPQLRNHTWMPRLLAGRISPIPMQTTMLMLAS